VNTAFQNIVKTQLHVFKRMDAAFRDDQQVCRDSGFQIQRQRPFQFFGIVDFD